MTETLTSIPVLDHGFVRLENVSASDLSVVNAARVSFAARQDVMDLRAERLIDFLVREGHTTPLEHNVFTFHIRAPLFVVQQWLKHRISSINQQSGRYSQFEDRFYVPDIIRRQTGKPGAYTFEPLDADLADDARGIIAVHNHMSYQLYLDLMADGVAKEQARLVLPPTLYTELWFTVNAHSLMHFLRLRNDEHAQDEIRQYAKAMEQMFANQMPVTYQAFIKHIAQRA